MLLKVTKKGGKEAEDVLLTSIMELRRGNPYKAASGHSQIDVQIKEWRARGYCKLIGKTIEYRLSASREQPSSAVQAMQAASDYPAQMTFNAIFDVFMDNNRILEGLNGSAQSVGLMSIPPRGNDTFTVDKPFEYDGFEMQTVMCAASAAQLTSGQISLLRLGSMLGLIPKSTRDNLM
ncbi:MAG: hypothetical protein Q8Q28_12800 [Pseudomonadota bacterium]|nr:hypothetical protein [Pseudomonadota bacterium]